MRFSVLKAARSSAMGVIAIGGALGLAGCSILLENPANGPISISKTGTSILVTVCDLTQVTEVRMSERARGSKWS